MLSRKERLTRSEFNRFFSVGKRLHSPSLTLIFAPHERFQASAVIGKKVAKTAVSRNKFRRRVYDVFERYHRNGLNTGVFICIAKQPASSLPYAALKEELGELIHKSGVLG